MSGKREASRYMCVYIKHTHITHSIFRSKTYLVDPGRTFLSKNVATLSLNP